MLHEKHGRVSEKLPTIFVMDNPTLSAVRQLRSMVFILPKDLHNTPFTNPQNVLWIRTQISRTLLDDSQVHPRVSYETAQIFGRARSLLLNGKNLVWPKDGIVTAENRLNVTAPLYAQAIELCREKLFTYAGEIKYL